MVLAVGGYTIVFDPRVVDGHIASFESTELDDHLVDGWVSPVDYTIAPWVKALVVWACKLEKVPTADAEIPVLDVTGLDLSVATRYINESSDDHSYQTALTLARQAAPPGKSWR